MIRLILELLLPSMIQQEKLRTKAIIDRLEYMMKQSGKS